MIICNLEGEVLPLEHNFKHQELVVLWMAPLSFEYITNVLLRNNCPIIDGRKIIFEYHPVTDCEVWTVSNS